MTARFSLSIFHVVLSLMLSTLILPSLGLGFQGQELFTVRDLTIEKRIGEKEEAASVKRARVLALQEGRIRAYRRLLETLIPDEEVDSLLILNGEDIQILLRDVEIKQEVATKDFYRVTTHWHFEPELVVSLLKQSDKPYLSRAPFHMLLVPLLRGGVDVMGHTLWSEAWHNLTQKRGIISYELYDDNRARLPISWDELLASELPHYKGGIFVPLAELFLDSDGSTDAAVVKSLVIKPDGSRDYILSDSVLNVLRHEGESEQDFYARSAAVLYKHMANRWKRAYRIDHESRIIPVTASVRYDGLKQWLALRKNLSLIPVLDDFQVENVTASGAVVTFNVVTALDDLRLHLRGLGLSLGRTNDGWVIDHGTGEQKKRAAQSYSFESEFLNEDEAERLYEAARQFQNEEIPLATKEDADAQQQQADDDLWSRLFSSGVKEDDFKNAPEPDRLPPFFWDL